MKTQLELYEERLKQIEKLLDITNPSQLARFHGLRELEKTINLMADCTIPYTNEGVVLGMLVTARNELASSIYTNFFNENKKEGVE